MRRLATGIFILCFSSFAVPTSIAQDTNTQDRLQQIEDEIKAREERRAKLLEDVDATRQELRDLSVEMVVLARAIQTKEQELSELEANIAALSEEENTLTNDINARAEDMILTLAALQRLSQQPADLILIKPEDTLTTVRTALLMTSALPALEEEAASLRGDLATLKDLKARLTEQRVELRVGLEALDAEQATLDEKRQTRNQVLANLEGEADAETRALQALADEAESLQELLDNINTRRANVTPKSGAIDLAPPDGGRDFGSARGTLRFPVAGQVTARFGSVEGPTTLKGIRIATRPGAQVTAPFEGRVVFSGTFRSYGQLLIIAHNGGYHSLLAGMSRIDAIVGQWVLAGEPVGQMPSEMPVTNSQDTELYIEIRRGSTAENPLRWFSDNPNNIGG